MEGPALLIGVPKGALTVILGNLANLVILALHVKEAAETAVPVEPFETENGDEKNAQ